MADLIYPEVAAAGEFVDPNAVHPTAGLEGYPALDFFARPGTAVVAPEPGEIVKLSGRDPAAGATSAHGAFGYSVYLKGDSGATYFITHLGARTVTEGAKVQRGQELGTVGDFPGGTPDHAHIGVAGGDVKVLAQAAKIDFPAGPNTLGHTINEPPSGGALDRIFGGRPSDPIGKLGYDVVHGAVDAVTGGAHAAASAASGLDAIGQAFGKLVQLLSDPIRLLEILGGLVMIGLGVYVLTRWVTSTAVSLDGGTTGIGPVRMRTSTLNLT